MMTARKVHEVLSIEYVELREMPRFLDALQKPRPHASKPHALLLQGHSSLPVALVVLRLSDLLELVNDHLMKAETVHGGADIS